MNVFFSSPFQCVLWAGWRWQSRTCVRGGAAWPSTTVSDSCPTAGGTYETQLVSGERSVCQQTDRHIYTYTVYNCAVVPTVLACEPSNFYSHLIRGCQCMSYKKFKQRNKEWFNWFDQKKSVIRTFHLYVNSMEFCSWQDFKRFNKKAMSKAHPVLCFVCFFVAWGAINSISSKTIKKSKIRKRSGKINIIRGAEKCFFFCYSVSVCGLTG